MAVGTCNHIVMAASFSMPRSCKVCNLPFCTMSAVAWLFTLPPLTCVLSWPKTNTVVVVSDGGFIWWALLCGSLACRRVCCTVRSCRITYSMPSQGPSTTSTSSAKRAAQVVKHVQSLGLPAHFAHDGSVLIDKFSVRCLAAGKSHEV